MKFTPIDLSSWPRGQMFYYFSKMAPTTYSLTVDIDVTDLMKYLKNNNIKFFPAYLWLVTTCLNKQTEFKVAYEEDTLGYYDYLTPLYASFHEDDKTISLMWTEYTDDFNAFYVSYLKDKSDHGDNHGILAKSPPPPNAYTVSTVPWISFKSFSVQTDNPSYFFPSVEAGKIYENERGRKMMPLSLTCHHATTDGYHVKKFLEDLKIQIADFIAPCIE